VLPILLRPLLSTKYVAFQVLISSSVLAGERCASCFLVSSCVCLRWILRQSVQTSFNWTIPSPHCMLDFLGCSLLAARCVCLSSFFPHWSRRCLSISMLSELCNQCNCDHHHRRRSWETSVLRPRSGALLSHATRQFFSLISFSSCL
jgi:hypothetical protein